MMVEYDSPNFDFPMLFGIDDLIELTRKPIRSGTDNFVSFIIRLIACQNLAKNRFDGFFALRIFSQDFGMSALRSKPYILAHQQNMVVPRRETVRKTTFKQDFISPAGAF